MVTGMSHDETESEPRPKLILPAGHDVHALAPEPAMYVPAGQLAQASDSVEAVDLPYLPGGQEEVQAVPILVAPATVGPNLPNGHAVQAPSLR